MYSFGVEQFISGPLLIDHIWQLSSISDITYHLPVYSGRPLILKICFINHTLIVFGLWSLKGHSA